MIKNNDVHSVVVRLAGDSGDGIQLMGSQFAVSTALAGADFATFPDFPAEIRAPVGTTFGVSAYQINLGGGPITTAGDAPQVLVAFNPAALKVSLPLLDRGALVIVNNDAFTARNLTKAGYDSDPREDGTLNDFQVVAADIGHLNLEAVKEFGLSKSEGGRCKNFYALGMLLWMFDREREPIHAWLKAKFKSKPDIADGYPGALARAQGDRKKSVGGIEGEDGHMTAFSGVPESEIRLEEPSATTSRCIRSRLAGGSGRRLRSTVHAPQSPFSHPSLVPVKPSCSLSTRSNVSDGRTTTSRCSPSIRKLGCRPSSRGWDLSMR